MASLPFLGLGLSSNMNVADVPHAYRLSDEQPGLVDFVEYSAPLAVEQARTEASLFPELLRRKEAVPVLFHPVHLNLYGPELESPEALRALEAHAAFVGSHWVGNDVAWWHVQGTAFPAFQYLSPPLTRAGMDDCARHAEHVQAYLNRPLALENPVVMAVRGEMHVLQFMGELHARTGCPLILDVGHLFSHQLACNLPLDAGMDDFPWEAVIEIHFAGGAVARLAEWRGRAVYIDDHAQAVRSEVMGLLEHAILKCPRLRAVTFEGDGHSDEAAVETLRRVRSWVPAPASRPAFEWSSKGKDQFGALTASGWKSIPAAVFEEAFGQRETAGDRDGGRAEAWVRWTGLVHTLDKAYPLTRMALLPRTNDVERWVVTEELAEVYALGRGDVIGAFARWARRRLREDPHAAAEALLAFESLHRNRMSRIVERFPIDLAPVHEAAASLRQSLTSAAWVEGPAAQRLWEEFLAAATRACAAPPR